MYKVVLDQQVVEKEPRLTASATATAAGGEMAPPYALPTALAATDERVECAQSRSKAKDSGIEPKNSDTIPDRLPSVVPTPDGRRLQISPAFLCALFAVGPRARWHPVDDPNVPREIAATFSTNLKYRGPRLDQDAGTVLLALVRREIGQQIGRQFTLALRPFGRSLTWSDSSSTSARCLRALRNLAAGSASYAWDGRRELEIRFLRIHENSATHVTLSFDPSFAAAFTGFQTYVDWERRTLLTVGLETWLYGVALSTTCRNPFAMHRLHYLSGSTKMLKQFGADAVRAMAKLVSYRLIRDCHLDGRPIHAARPDLFSNDTPDINAPMEAARMRPVTYLRIIKGATPAPEDARSSQPTGSKARNKSAVVKDPDPLQFEFDQDQCFDDDYDESAPNLDDLPRADDDE